MTVDDAPFTDTEAEPEEVLDPEWSGAKAIHRKAKTGRKRRRKPLKRATIVVHRWTSLVLGLVLIVICTTGAAVVYSPEWTKWTNESVFSVTPTDHPVSFSQAITTVERSHPDFRASYVNVYDGLYEVFSTDDSAPFYGVDPGTGRITGSADPNHGFMALMNQVHECFFTCDSYPAYASFLNANVPTLGMAWLADTTWGSFVLGVFGLFLVFLAVSGIWLWWPTIKRFGHGFRVRWKRGRYARDYDLHQVIGIAAVPFLLIWGLTGASFEFPWVNTAWYAVTGGANRPDSSFASADVKDPKTPDIGLDAAITSARTIGRAGDWKLQNAFLPDADDPTSTYSLWFSTNFDQYRHGAYPGNYEVMVDRHDASRTEIDDYGSAPTLSNQLLDNWGSGLFHYGQSFNGWWRIIWFGFGLTPLALGITGTSTWLAKRSVKKRRRQALKAKASGGEPAPAGMGA